MASLRELARRQNALREVNERIHELGWRDDGAVQSGYVCECSRPDCTETVELATQVYEAVRSVPVRFVLVPGHAQPDVERIVEQHAAYVIVDNIGEAAELARTADPRSTRPERPAAPRARPERDTASG
jgi:hypothetical protein